MPLAWAFTSSWALTAPKNLLDSNGAGLSLSGHLLHPYLRAEYYVEANLTIVDLNQIEILEIVEEARARVQGFWTDDANDEKHREAFLSALKESSFSDVHDYFHPDARLSTMWMRRHK